MNHRPNRRATCGTLTLVAIFLAEHADSLGTTTATIDELCYGTGLTEDSVRRTLRELERRCVIDIYPPIRPGLGCRYVVTNSRTPRAA